MKRNETVRTHYSMKRCENATKHYEHAMKWYENTMKRYAGYNQIAKQRKVTQKRSFEPLRSAYSLFSAEAESLCFPLERDLGCFFFLAPAPNPVESKLLFVYERLFLGGRCRRRRERRGWGPASHSFVPRASTPHLSCLVATQKKFLQ